MKTNAVLCGMLLLCMLSCTKQVTRQSVSVTGGNLPPVTVRSGDTTAFIIGFSDKKEKKRFTGDIRGFLENYTFADLGTDTVREFFHLLLVPEKRGAADTLEKLIVPEKAAFTELETVHGDAPQPLDTTLPRAGGAATIYTNRQFLDATLRQFSNRGCRNSIDTGFAAAPLRISQISPQKVEIRLTAQANQPAHPVSAFDLTQSWTDLARNNPAEGFALFPHVKGLRDFIAGREGIIRGFTVVNEQTVQISTDTPDPDFLRRLASPLLPPPRIQSGPYTIKRRNGNTLTLEKNSSPFAAKPFLDRLTIVCGGDNNPLISFSLNKYDIVILEKKQDLEYARRTPLKNGRIIPFPTDRYFLSLASKPAELRRYIAGAIRPQDILHHAVRTEGELIASIMASQPPLRQKTADSTSAGNPPRISQPLVIVYDAGDPVSITIAEKLFSDLTHNSLQCSLSGLTSGKLELTLVNKSYDIAVAWTPESINEDKTEQLRVASIWFDHIIDEQKRLDNNLELPLFTVKRYALCKNTIAFHGNQVSGVYLTEKE